MSQSDIQRREVYYSGRVQGVGFRYTVRSLASRLAVTGFVRNLSDGRVHLVAEGAKEEIQQLLDAIDARLGYCVTDAQQTTSPASGRFQAFEIRF